MRAVPRWRLLVLLVLLVGAGLLVARRYFLARRSSAPMPIAGGRAMEVRLNTVPYLQGDPRWADVKLGSTAETLGAAGCTVSSLAMALTSQGSVITPPELNAALQQQKGFTESGLVIWAAVSPASQGRFSVTLVDRPLPEIVDDQLSTGNPVLAKVLYHGAIWHWVLVSGKTGTNYLMHDPLGDGTPCEPMTRYPAGIFALRYLEKTPGANAGSSP